MPRPGENGQGAPQPGKRACQRRRAPAGGWVKPRLKAAPAASRPLARAHMTAGGASAQAVGETGRCGRQAFRRGFNRLPAQRPATLTLPWEKGQIGPDIATAVV